MTLVVLRLGAPLQSWSGYRHLLSMDSVAPTEAVPRKSAINGLIGAALGSSDQGYGSARDLGAIGQRYELHARVDARNPAAEDFQILGPLPVGADATADRTHRIGDATTQGFPNLRRGRGAFPNSVSRRDYLAHTEFLLALELESATAEVWRSALREPVFMPYLGRRSCAPTFPYLLGLCDAGVEDLFDAMPRVDKYRDGAAQVGYRIFGDYDQHLAHEHERAYSPPTAIRSEQLAWAKEHMR